MRHIFKYIFVKSLLTLIDILLMVAFEIAALVIMLLILTFIYESSCSNSKIEKKSHFNSIKEEERADAEDKNYNFNFKFKGQSIKLKVKKYFNREKLNPDDKVSDKKTDDLSESHK